MNHKGFTLIELIATITIMGFVSLMTFPSIQNILSSHRTSSCKYYEKAMIAAMKSYMQKESVDLFEDKTSSSYKRIINGEYALYKGNLINLGYLEEYEDANSSIDGASLVYVKYDEDTNTYTYSVKLKCLNKKGEVIYEKK